MGTIVAKERFCRFYLDKADRHRNPWLLVWNCTAIVLRVLSYAESVRLRFEVLRIACARQASLLRRREEKAGRGLWRKQTDCESRSGVVSGRRADAHRRHLRQARDI